MIITYYGEQINAEKEEVKMRLGDRLNACLKNVILKLKSIVGWWFDKNIGLKIGVFIFWTLWMLGTARLPQNQDFPLYQVVALYVGGYFVLYFVLYFVCIVISLLNDQNKTKKTQSTHTHSQKQTFSMQQVDAMTGVEFENFCVNILRENGYGRIQKTKATGDQGVDIIAEKDNRKYAIQCKCYKSPVGNHAVMEVCSGRIYYGCDIGVVMTNSTFTPGAIEHAKKTGVLLWNRGIIGEMLK